MNIVDKLIEGVIRTRNPSVIGLDPDFNKIPACYKNVSDSVTNPISAVADVLERYVKDLIDTICDIVPAVKPQTAFYEKYGSYGIRVLENIIKYAKERGLVVIEDAKRNDIGNTAKAYAQGHLGVVELFDEKKVPSFNADYLTVSPFLGSESLEPFIEVCKSNNKGIFVLVKTSNPSSGEIQNVINSDGISVSQSIAKYIAEKADSIGIYGYSPIGAVVGATYPKEASVLRSEMPNSYFLVPGFGAQGGSAENALCCFKEDGLGAIVNSSQGVLYMHMSDEERMECTQVEYLSSVRKAVLDMQMQIYGALKSKFYDIKY